VAPVAPEPLAPVAPADPVAPVGPIKPLNAECSKLSMRWNIMVTFSPLRATGNLSNTIRFLTRTSPTYKEDMTFYLSRPDRNKNAEATLSS
jgi:hypothetical protein